MLDKSRSYKIAERAGVPTPRFAILRELAEIDPALHRLPFPCGIKPLEGHVFRERTGLSEKVIVMDGPERLKREAEEWLRQGLA